MRCLHRPSSPTYDFTVFPVHGTQKEPHANPPCRTASDSHTTRTKNYLGVGRDAHRQTVPPRLRVLHPEPAQPKGRHEPLCRRCMRTPEELSPRLGSRTLSHPRGL